MECKKRPLLGIRTKVLLDGSCRREFITRVASLICQTISFTAEELEILKDQLLFSVYSTLLLWKPGERSTDRHTRGWRFEGA